MNDARTDELRDEKDEEPTIEVENEHFPWTESKEEWRRSFVFENMANSDMDIYILIENMEHAVKWLVDGTVPRKQENPKKGLKSV